MKKGSAIMTISFAAIFIPGVKVIRILIPFRLPIAAPSKFKLDFENEPTGSTRSKALGNTGPSVDWMEI